MTMDIAVPISMTDDFVRCVNKTEDNLIFTWAAKDYLVRAHSEAFVPFQAMATRFGHPQQGVVPNGQTPNREYELRRLEGQFGISSFMSRDTGKSVLELMLERMPDIEFYQLDGTRIITVMDDPTGDIALSQYDEGTPNDPATLQAMIIRMREQINYLSQAQEAMSHGNMAPVSDIPKDEPGSGMGTPQRARGLKGGIQATPPPMPPLEDDSDANPMTLEDD